MRYAQARKRYEDYVRALDDKFFSDLNGGNWCAPGLRSLQRRWSPRPAAKAAAAVQIGLDEIRRNRIMVQELAWEGRAASGLATCWLEAGNPGGERLARFLSLWRGWLAIPVLVGLRHPARYRGYGLMPI
jgi:hypothetical protein